MVLQQLQAELLLQQQSAGWANRVINANCCLQAQPWQPNGNQHRPRYKVAQQLQQRRCPPDMLPHNTDVCCGSSWLAITTAVAQRTYTTVVMIGISNDLRTADMSLKRQQAAQSRLEIVRSCGPTLGHLRLVI